MRFKCTCAYDGTDFNGWQSQPNGNAVQDHLEARLKDIFKQVIRIHGSGRTDSGVHSRGQVFHFDADWAHSEEKLLRAFQTKLPVGIQVLRVKRVKSDFHARYSVKRKRYIYRMNEGLALPEEWRYTWSLGNRKLDVDVMQEAANRLVGVYDFTAFGANRGDDSIDNPIKNMTRLDVLKQGGGRIRMITESSGYLYKMVRSLAGTLVEVGWGKLTPDQVEAALRNKQRIQLIKTAPAQGLWLDKVFY